MLVSSILRISCIGLLGLGLLMTAGPARADLETVPNATAMDEGTQVSEDDDLAEMNLADLMALEITSVSRKAERLSHTAAAIHVITGEDIRRSGVTSIPEALRMAPGLHVANITGNRWAISSRGFSDEFANKLLVLIDGRSVYTPLFSGVFWDVQDVMLEDVDRIEVIRGPGATVWGANAVNGVINIITKKASDTQGGLLTGGAGSYENGFGGFRWGGSVGDDLHYRIYGKYFDRDSLQAEGPGDGEDDWTMSRAGFRIDWRASDRDDLTLQGDIYRGEVGWRTTEFRDYAPLDMGLVSQNIDVEGWNMLGRWTRELGEASEVSVQAYFDRTERPIEFLKEVRKTTDLDMHHRLPLGERHDIVWGAGYRWTTDDTKDSISLMLDPASRSDHLFSAFIQDEIELWKDRLSLTLGSKFEHNDYTGFEYQPSGRLLFTPNDDHTFWASVSRAVRTPSRTDHDVRFPFQATTESFRETFSVAVPTGLPFPFPATVDMSAPVAFDFSVVPFLTGDEDVESERLLSYEAGYRFTPSPRFSIDVAAFYNDYGDLRSVEVGLADSSALEAFIPTAITASLLGASTPTLDEPGVTSVILLANEIEARTHGVEVASHLEVLDWWNVHLSYSWMVVNVHTRSRSLDATSEDSLEHSSPSHMLHVRSLMDLPHGFEIDTSLYYVEGIFGGDVPSNVRVDLRLGWEAREGLRFSVVGQNLFDGRRPEFEDSIFGPRSLVERSVHGKVEWAF
ncbi:MAG: TonB-dependent receptor [bacterium]|nr:TonB-dependent receptor [bacterium]